MLAFFGVFCLLASVFIFKSSAQTYTVNQGISSNNSGAASLVAAYRSSEYWNPFADYIIFQIANNTSAGESSHYIGAFGDLDNPHVFEIKNVNLNRVSGTVINYLGQDSNFSVSNSSNYSVIGSSSGQLHSDLMETYKFQFVLIVFAFVFLIVFLFKSFRFNHSPYRG